ncbi:toll/interleukin-1 receptor domain-containing protein [Rhodoferax sp. BLA1]|uniref:toll/interleukin-1 receptor domain-containing protein n=1 Tax=Rhodoferax sp. BLA1 TaxID=2576062 RepID=UPI001C553A1A|nr:toll/interleukin-1 receptor domain-containing protein [Rhodoferax sp. BLA1]
MTTTPTHSKRKRLLRSSNQDTNNDTNQEETGTRFAAGAAIRNICQIYSSIQNITPELTCCPTSGLPEYRDTIDAVKKQQKQSCKPLSGGFDGQHMEQFPTYRADVALNITLGLHVEFMSTEHIPYGPVYITDGPHSGRIGNYDDNDTEFSDDIDFDLVGDDDDIEGRRVAIVYFGDFFLANGYYIIPDEYVREVTTADLLKRREELHNLIGRFAAAKGSPKVGAKRKIELLTELHFVEGVLVDRMIHARYSNKGQGAKIFISHSSKDKQFATWLGTDLKTSGHTPWFDEWDICVGESIPEKISDGLSSADFIIVVLSTNSIKSKWMEREWHAKYWSEIEKNRTIVLPLLIEDCTIPELLKTKKYADFRSNYNDGLEDVLFAVDRLLETRPTDEEQS